MSQSTNSQTSPLEGAWITVSAITHGVENPAVVDYISVYQGAAYWWYSKDIGQSELFSFKLGTDGNLKTIDILDDEGVSRGIYMFTGELLIICSSEDDMPRPLAFESTKCNKWNLSEHRKLDSIPARVAPPVAPQVP